jgi:hypothetical protein
MAHAGAIDVVRKVTNVNNATIDGNLRDKERNARLFIPTSSHPNRIAEDRRKPNATNKTTLALAGITKNS